MEGMKPDVFSFSAAMSCCEWPMALHLLLVDAVVDAGFRPLQGSEGANVRCFVYTERTQKRCAITIVH